VVATTGAALIGDLAMSDLWLIARALLLLAVANSTPMFATNLFKDRYNTPLDGGLTFFDGRPFSRVAAPVARSPRHARYNVRRHRFDCGAVLRV
jgi:hypothetical protein